MPIFNYCLVTMVILGKDEAPYLGLPLTKYDFRMLGILQTNTHTKVDPLQAKGKKLVCRFFNSSVSFPN